MFCSSFGQWRKNAFEIYWPLVETKPKKLITLMPMKIVQKSKKVLCICNSLIAVYSSKKVINFMIIVPRNSRISEWDYWLGSLCWPPPSAILDCWRGTTKKCAIPKFYLIDIKPVRPWKCNKLIRLRWKSWKNFCFKDCARHGNLIMGFIK